LERRNLIGNKKKFSIPKESKLQILRPVPKSCPWRRAPPAHGASGVRAGRHARVATCSSAGDRACNLQMALVPQIICFCLLGQLPLPPLGVGGGIWAGFEQGERFLPLGSSPLNPTTFYFKPLNTFTSSF
jgi:hypothetical protein